MSIWDRYAGLVYRTAVGNKRIRAIVTFPVAVVFLSWVALFILASFWLDKRWLFLHFESSPWNLGPGVMVLIIGWLIFTWSAWVFLRARGTPVPFNPPSKLIISGPYKYIRNPMLLGLYIFLLGLGVILGSLSLIFIFTPLFALISVFYLKVIEEQEMEKRFGRQYLEYKAKVPMFIPRLKKVGK